MIAKYGMEWYEKQKQKTKEFKKTFEGRISQLSYNYKNYDMKRFGDVDTITKKQLLDLIKNGCYWCGESDWHKLGADRIDNTKPHTLENCVCGCMDCNRKREHEELSRKILQCTIDGEFISEYSSIRDAERKTGVAASSISQCCNEKIYKSAGGYIWKWK